MTALVLVGMSVREADARHRLTAAAARRDGAVAFLQMGEPSLDRELTRNDLDLDLVLDVSRPVSGTEAPLTSAAWEDVPGHRHQLFVCRGPRCTGLGGVTPDVAGTIATDHLVTHRPVEAYRLPRHIQSDARTMNIQEKS